MYVRGFGIDVSDCCTRAQADLQGRQYLDIAVRLKSPAAQYLLGSLLVHGRACSDHTLEGRATACAEGRAMLSEAANAGHPKAHFELAELDDDAVGLDTSTDAARRQCMEDAVAHYKAAAAGGYQPEHCMGRAAVIATLASADSRARAPWFSLFVEILRQKAKQRLEIATLQLVVHRYCRERASRMLDRSFPNDLSTNHSRDIACIMLQAPPPGISPAMARAQSVVDDFGKKQSEESREQLHVMQIRQHLAVVDGRWTREDTMAMVVALRDQVRRCASLAGPFDSATPLRVLRKRLDEIGLQQPTPIIDLSVLNMKQLKAQLGQRGLRTSGNKPDLIARLAAAPCTEGWGVPKSGSPSPSGGTSLVDYVVTHVWDFEADDPEMERRAMKVWALVEAPSRRLSAQVRLHEITAEVMKLIGAAAVGGAASIDEALKYAPLVIKLMDESGDVEPDVRKHLLSAQALRHYAETRFGNDVIAARQQLDVEAGRLLQAQMANLDSYASVGYHVLVNLDPWHRALQESLREANAGSMVHRQQILADLRRSGMDGAWCRGIEEYAASLSGEMDPSRARLTELSVRAVSALGVIPGIPDLAGGPAINIAACTHQDPWILLLDAGGIDAEFKEVREAAEQRQAEFHISMEECLEGLLSEELATKVRRLSQCLGQASAASLDSIVQVMHRDPHAAHRIAAKKKVLFMLRHSAAPSAWDKDGEVDGLRIVGEALIAGTRGRCPDGQASFFINWVTEYMLNHAPTGSGPSKALRSLQFKMALLILDIKRVFIAMHGSRFEFGQHIGANDASEDRTAMGVLLHNVLRLPFSLPGDYAPVLYPRFAFRTLVDSERAIEVSNVVQRFVGGGSISHRDRRTWKEEGGGVRRASALRTVTTNFEPLTLRRLGKEVRDAMVEERRGAPQRQPEGILGVPRVTFLLGEEVVDAFACQDVVLSTSFAKFRGSHCTHSNLFFDADGALRPGGAVLRNVMRDVAILRILEVCGYATVPAGFYNTVGRDWHF
jgi:hypothetical protein